MRRISWLLSATLAALLPLGIAGCGGDDGGSSFEPEPLNADGEHHTFVVNSLQLPTTPSESSALGLNIDFDDHDTPDNQLGKILATLASAAGDSFNVQASLDTAVNQGTIILLADVQATSLSAATGVGMWVFLGDPESPSTPPCSSDTDMVCGKHLDGMTSFEISADSPTDALITGTVAGGKFKGGPGTVRLDLPLVGNQPLTLDLIGAQADVSVAASGLMSGRLGGAVTEDALHDDVLPALQTIISDTAAADCTATTPPCCTEDSTGATLYELFDEDESCDITLAELENSSLISTLLAPDLDLLDKNGDFSPNKDGVKDSLSLGIGFSAVPGSFTPPVQ